MDFYTGAWPTDADLKEAEDQAREKLRDLSDTPETAQYRARIDDGSVVKRWLFIASLKLEDRCQAILAALPETAEKTHFTTLIDRGHAHALSASLGAIGWSQSNRVLRDHYKQTGDTRALGAIVGALEKRKGSPLVDLAEIPDTWVQRAVSRVGLDRLPRAGSGPQETTPAVKRTKVKKRQRTYRQRDQEAEKNLRSAIQGTVSGSRGLSRAMLDAARAKQKRIITTALASTDPHIKKAAKKLQEEYE